MSGDPMDLPDEGGMELVVPFVACVSHGGPYDDDSFVAGYQAGAVDRMLAVAELVGADRVAVPFAVRTDLGRQLELIGMHRGYPVVDVATVGAGEGYDAMPQWWSFVTFARGPRGGPRRMNEMTERQWLVRSRWPTGATTEAVYSSADAAELEAYFRRRYSGCAVEPILTRTVTYTDWELAS